MVDPRRRVLPPDLIPFPHGQEEGSAEGPRRGSPPQARSPHRSRQEDAHAHRPHGRARARLDPQARPAGAQVPRARALERPLRRQGRLLRDRPRAQGARAHGEHGQELRADAAPDVALEGDGRERRPRDEARGLLRQQELGRLQVQRAARVGHGHGRHRGAREPGRDHARAAALLPGGARRRGRRRAGRDRPRQDQRRGAAHRLHAHGLGRLHDPELGRAPALRDQGQVRARHRDRRHVPAPERAQVLAERQLHPGRHGRRPLARARAASSAASPTRRSSPSTPSSTAIPTASPTSIARSRSARATPRTSIVSSASRTRSTSA